MPAHFFFFLLFLSCTGVFVGSHVGPNSSQSCARATWLGPARLHVLIDDQIESKALPGTQTGQLRRPEIGDLIWSCVSGFFSASCVAVHICGPEFGVQFGLTFPGGQDLPKQCHS